MLTYAKSGYADLNETKLYYEIAGQGHPLVLSHGWLGDYSVWDNQFEAFAQHFTVVRYDIRGFGRSGKREKGMAPFSMEQDLYSLLQFLNIKKTFLLGVSMGSALAIDFTLQYPTMVDALVTVSSGLTGFEETPDEGLKEKFGSMHQALRSGDLVGASEVLLQIWTDGLYRTPEQVDPQIRERMRTTILHNLKRGDDPSVQPQKIDPPAFDRLAEIQVPTLVIAGDLDVKNIQLIAETLEKGIVNAKRVVVPGTAHYPNVEKPQEFNKEVIEFLKRL